MNKKSGQNSLQPFVIGCLVVYGIWIGSIWLNILFFENAHNELAAWFGDSFGAINTLFSGMAFAGIIYTILLQRKELQLQREELKQTRIELQRSADSQEKSEELFRKQGEMMKRTAQLNGLNQVMEYYNIALNNTDRKSANRGKLIDKMKTARKKAESILNELESEN